NGGYFVLSDWGPTSAAHVKRQLVANWAEFEYVFDARTKIEALIASTAAARRTPVDLVQIRQALHDYITATDHDASRRADSDLHLSIAQATHNPIFVELSVDLRTRISLNLGAEPYTDAVRKTAIRQHQELVEAVEEERSDDAARIAAGHFILSEDLMRELVARTESDTTRSKT
ncbi:MAG: FCD domain-containing protein, partial [Alphaproteobacteria bacterium]|nr:FCD domain-containing protein [Alphaproteobacteria bacterium]